MQNIEFEDRAVAFIDVLGFKSIVNFATQDTNKLNELSDLIILLESVVPNLDGTVDSRVPKSLIPKHIYISDSIILSAPLKSTEIRLIAGKVIKMLKGCLSILIMSAPYLVKH